MLIIYVWKLGENLTKFMQLIVKVYVRKHCNVTVSWTVKLWKVSWKVSFK